MSGHQNLAMKGRTSRFCSKPRRANTHHLTGMVEVETKSNLNYKIASQSDGRCSCCCSILSLPYSQMKSWLCLVFAGRWSLLETANLHLSCWPGQGFSSVIGICVHLKQWSAIIVKSLEASCSIGHVILKGGVFGGRRNPQSLRRTAVGP